MQPNSRLPLDPQSFELLKRTVQNAVITQRQRRQTPLKLPETLGVKLTNRCNLRCEHCYQWNEEGYHRHMSRSEQSMDLDVGVFERLLAETRPVKSRLYLWGGEPLVHRQIKRVLELLEQDRRETTICTNAHFISRHLDGLCRISADLEFLIAVEGFEAEHDLLRGKGSFQKVMSTIDHLLDLRRAGVFLGKLSIHTVINNKMVGRFYELMEYYEAKGIDLVLLCFPWYISPETSKEMDEFVQANFDWLIETNGRPHSWDAFKFRLDPGSIAPLMEDLQRINSRTWATKIRYQPGLEFDEIEDFVRGKSMTARCATRCKVLDNRIDLTPNGKVSACKFFSEFNVGSLHEQSLAEIWQSDAYGKIREILGQKLSPACSKCNVLYLHDHSTPVHI
jgi:radical SAM protein with 4Fe4S-binding SPASM domain